MSLPSTSPGTPAAGRLPARHPSGRFRWIDAAFRRVASRASSRRAVSFGDIRLDLETGELRRHGLVVPLRPLATRALLLLVTNRPRLVDRDALRNALWGEAALEWETGLHQIVRQLRRALGDDPRNPVFIETVAWRGYRFTGDVTVEADAARPPDGHHPSRVRDGALVLAGALGLPALIVIACLLLAA